MAGGIGGEARNAALLVLVLMGTAALLPPVALLVAPVPVAVFMARGNWRQCGLILALISVTGAVTGGGFEGGAAFLMAGVVGIPLGAYLRRRATYGSAVTLTAALFFILYALIMVGAWDDVESTVEELKTQLQLITGDQRSEDVDAQTLAQAQLQEWLLDHWREAVLGLTFVGVFLGVCLVASITSGWLNRGGMGQGFVGSFRTMRPPEWLVWVVIATAGLWFLDQQWPSGALRLVAWNAAFALSGVYWANGLSVLLYSLGQWRPGPLVLALIVMALVFLNLMSLLPLLGLFDTWGEFRTKVDKWVAAREARDKSQDNEL